MTWDRMSVIPPQSRVANSKSACASVELSAMPCNDAITMSVAVGCSPRCSAISVWISWSLALTSYRRAKMRSWPAVSRSTNPISRR